MEINKELLEKVMSHIEFIPASSIQDITTPSFPPRGESWCQEIWINSIYDREDNSVCGTAACFAGWTLIMAKGKDAAIDSDISYDAANALGITREQARELFKSNNTRIQLRSMVNAIIADPDISWFNLYKIKLHGEAKNE